MTNTPDYKAAILQQLASIPFGKACSYGYLAKAAGLPGYARQVGNIMKSLPHNTQLPWHRIVNSQRKISFPIGSEAYLEQRRRLEAEGIEFKGEKILITQFL